MVTNVNRQHDGTHIRGDRMGSDGSGDSGESPGHSRWFGGRYGYSREMVVLEQEKEETPKDNIHTTESGMDKQVEPLIITNVKEIIEKQMQLKIPDRTDWLSYLSYLQTNYG